MKTWFKKGKIFDVGKLETLIFSLLSIISWHCSFKSSVVPMSSGKYLLDNVIVLALRLSIPSLFVTLRNVCQLMKSSFQKILESGKSYVFVSSWY